VIAMIEEIRESFKATLANFNKRRVGSKSLRQSSSNSTSALEMEST